MNAAAKDSLERILYYFSLPALIFGLLVSWLLAGVLGLPLLRPEFFVGTLSLFILAFLPGAVATVLLSLVRIGVTPFRLGWQLRVSLLAFLLDLVLLAFFQGSGPHTVDGSPSLFVRLGGDLTLGSNTYVALLIVYGMSLLLIIINAIVLLLQSAKQDREDPNRIIRDALAGDD